MVFTKLHATILDSSVWQEPAHVRLVWITMLAMAGHDGVVQASVGGLAHRARVTREECAQALALFMGPDPDSRDRTTGERIEEVPGGWLVLNHANYRDRQTREQALTAARVARHRAKRVTIERYVTPGNGTSPNISAHLPTSPSEGEADASGVPRRSRGPAAGAASVVDSPRASPRLPDSSGGDIATSTSVPTSPNAASEQGAATTTPPATSSPRSGQAKAVPVPKPADVTDAVWQDWLAHRRAKKSTVTQRVLDDTRRKATAAGMTMDEALTHWVAQGYAGFFPPASKPGASGGATFDRSGVIMKSAPPGYYSGPAVQDL